MYIGKISRIETLINSRKIGGKPTRIVSSKKKQKREKTFHKKEIENLIKEYQ